MDADQITNEPLAERRFARTVLSLVMLGFAAIALAGLAAVAVMLRGEEQTAAVNHTYLVERGVGDIRLALERMRSARRAFALGIDAEQSGGNYQAAKTALFEGIRTVGALTTDNPVQQANVAELEKLARQLDSLFVTSMRYRVDRSPVMEATRQRQAMLVQQLSERMLAEERRLLNLRNGARDESARNFYIILSVTAVLLLVVGGGSIVIIRRYTRELSVSRDQLRALNDNLEQAVSERTSDLQRANDEIQRFAYIVSHDLRSPLVNVMGFTAELDAAVQPLGALLDRVEAEAPALAEEEVKLAVREDLPEAIGFIRSSTQKMDRLINAILRLSREGRRTVTPEPLDLGVMAESVVDALRHRIDELGIVLTVDEDMPAVVSDRVAVEQILSNLVENAVKYLKPGRPGVIRIGARQEPGRVLVDVVDNGRGIDPRDHERIFDLFRRSGEQDQPGEGIGLAHVRASAYRLGGTISVASALDEGATFTINLPAVFTGEKAALS